MVVTWAIDQKGYSQRRACALIGIAPKTYRYVTSRGDDSEFRARGCVALLPNAGGSAIGACISCCLARSSS